ncbi:hypothetical protein C4565_07500 [Candidatus Parcubacteria bacterium]|jgi:hypothetical protein|nr:MAG: hypothetical protein C4565_07500 [Candidatus Parcubacteria bacterium]
MNQKKKNIFITIGLTVFVVGLFVLLWYSAQPEPPTAEVTALSLCLKEKGVVMYGTYWCPHCQNQKKEFGSAFENITYVECTEREKECIDAGVQGYPTWTFPDGTQLAGQQELYVLAKKAGCPF